uniref:Uncharacterized protein n=1 Tax=Cacopsylla melanoneura TaxID=428564 RepID=A0A8D8YKE9_9HEMI
MILEEEIKEEYAWLIWCEAKARAKKTKVDEAEKDEVVAKESRFELICKHRLVLVRRKIPTGKLRKVMKIPRKDMKLALLISCQGNPSTKCYCHRTFRTS